MAPSAVEPIAVPQSKGNTPHPYAPLSAAEIQNASDFLRAQWPTGTDIQFKSLTLQEPPKKDVLPYLEAENSGKTASPLSRKACLDYYLRNTVGIPCNTI